jgi:hypothetical protein
VVIFILGGWAQVSETIIPISTIVNNCFVFMIFPSYVLQKAGLAVPRLLLSYAY